MCIENEPFALKNYKQFVGKENGSFSLQQTWLSLLELLELVEVLFISKSSMQNKGMVKDLS